MHDRHYSITILRIVARGADDRFWSSAQAAKRRRSACSRRCATANAGHVTILDLMVLEDARLTYFYAGRHRQLSQFGGSVIGEIKG